MSHSRAQKILPAWIYNRLIGDWDRDGFKKYFFNTGWIFSARMVAYVVSFLTMAIIARYLGPDNFGKLSYAQTFVSLFSVFASLGIDQILLRDLVAHPEKEYELLGTACIAKLLFGLLTFFITIISSLIINDDPILTWLIGIIALAFIIQPFGVISQVFTAAVKSKYLAYATIAVAFLIPALKLLVVFFDNGILYFAGVITLEALIYVLAYIFVYHYYFKRNLWQRQFSYTRLLKLSRDSLPLVLASFSGYIYARIDQVMIQHYLDSSAVGFYDIAVRLTDLLGFAPGVIIGSLFPAIVSARTRDRAEYKKRFTSLIWLMVSMTTISAVIMCIAAPTLITLVFGTAFAPAIPLVRIYVWSMVGTLGVLLMQQYFIAEHRSQLFLLFSIIGAAINISLNMWLIPALGMAGAAYATLVTVIALLAIFFLSRDWLFRITTPKRSPN
jgi:O-antigen/teichoic acid export membrane protein